MASQVSKNIQALAEAAEERRRLQEQIRQQEQSGPEEQGSREEQRGRKEQSTAPSLAGLGLGSAAFAAQTGRGPANAPAPKLSSFAQQVAATDTARLNAPTSNTIFGRNVPTNPLNPSVGPMTKQPSLTAAQEAASQAARATAGRGPSAMAQLGQFADNALSGASKFARAANIPSLMLTPNAMGDATLTGNDMALGPIDQMATDQYQEMLRPTIRQESLINPPSAAEAGDNLINIGNSLFPQEQPANLMTPERGEFKPTGGGGWNFGGNVPISADRGGGFIPTKESVFKLLASGTPEFANQGRGYQPPAPETPAPEITAPTNGMDINQLGASELEQIQGQAPQVEATFTLPSGEVRSIMAGQDVASAFGREYGRPTALKASGGDMNAQQAGLSSAQKNFLARREQGTPLKPDEINAAQRYATSQGQIFDPETGYSQAEFYGQRYKGQSIGDYLRGEDRSNLAPEYSSYSRESAAREARLANKLDFNEPFVYRDGKKVAASEARKDVMSRAQALKISGGNKKEADRMIELQKMGRDPLTGQLEKTEGITDYQAETLRQNQERIDFAKEEAEAARQAAKAKGSTQAQRDAFEMKQKQLNYAITHQDFLKDQEDPVFDAKDIEADLGGIQSQLDIVWDPEASVFRRGKVFGKGEVIKIDDPKNAGIVETIGTYKVGQALLNKYPKKG
jgi:hypothetical protein